MLLNKKNKTPNALSSRKSTGKLKSSNKIRINKGKIASEREIHQRPEEPRFIVKVQLNDICPAVVKHKMRKPEHEKGSLDISSIFTDYILHNDSDESLEDLLTSINV